MKNILLVYLPFCTPVTPPYSITNLYSFLKNNTSHNINALDLNLEFHKIKFPEYQKYYQESDWQDHAEKTSQYLKITGKIYSENNKKVVNNKKPELLDHMLKRITQSSPDLVCLSIVYSSQAFYAMAILKELNKLNIKSVIGGPAVNSKLLAHSKALCDENALLKFIDNTTPKNKDTVLDYSIYDLNEYFTPKSVIPIKTSSSCYYKRCTYCTHYNDQPYHEFPIENIVKSIKLSKQKHFFLIDDMIHKKRLLELAKAFEPLNIKWTCQLKPTNDLDLKTLQTLKKSGLTMVMWGVESASDRILSLIQKGTNIKDIGTVIKNSHEAKIKNVLYMIAGFPTETKEEFLTTIQFLKTNEEYIDLISFSVFGLQKGTDIYENPEKYSIKITEQERTVLEPKLTYEVKKGLSQRQAAKLRSNYQKTIEKINFYPKSMNFFREHMFILS